MASSLRSAESKVAPGCAPDLQRPWQWDNVAPNLQRHGAQFSCHKSTNTDIDGKSKHFPDIHQHNCSKGQHMQKAEMSIPKTGPAKKKVAKAAKAETITLRHLAMTLAEGHEVPKSQVNAMLMGMVGEI